MASEPLTDEREYGEERRERLIDETRARRGVSRRRLLQMAAAGVPLLAGAGRLSAPPRAAAAPGDPAPPPRSASRCRPSGSRASAPTPRCAGTPCRGRGTRSRTSASSSATTRRRRRSTRRRGGCDRGRRAAQGAGGRSAIPICCGCRAARSRRSSSARATGAASSAASRARPPPGPRGASARSASRAGAAFRCSVLLDRARVDRKRAVDVMPEGLDATVVANGVDQGHVRRPLSIGKALDDALVAVEMNGEPLPPDHGFPARLVVPGWIGVASIKWLGRIEVADAPLVSYWNTHPVPLHRRRLPGRLAAAHRAGGQERVRAAPAGDAGGRRAGHAARPLVVGPRPRSAAWRSSNDGGATWHRRACAGRTTAARGCGGRSRGALRGPGAYELLARATDDRGNMQPDGGAVQRERLPVRRGRAAPGDRGLRGDGHRPEGAQSGWGTIRM